MSNNEPIMQAVAQAIGCECEELSARCGIT
jgi:hypothetical protein